MVWKKCVVMIIHTGKWHLYLKKFCQVRSCRPMSKKNSDRPCYCSLLNGTGKNDGCSSFISERCEIIISACCKRWPKIRGGFLWGILRRKGHLQIFWTSSKEKKN